MTKKAQEIRNKALEKAQSIKRVYEWEELHGYTHGKSLFLTLCDEGKFFHEMTYNMFRYGLLSEKDFMELVVTESEISEMGLQQIR